MSGEKLHDFEMIYTASGVRTLLKCRIFRLFGKLAAGQQTC